MAKSTQRVRFTAPHGSIKMGSVVDLEADHARGLKTYNIVDFVGDDVALTEQAEKPADDEGGDSGSLAEDFPARDLLIPVELDTPEKVKEASDEQLLAIDGLGPKKLKEIREALA